jgi:hypothetical protein
MASASALRGGTRCSSASSQSFNALTTGWGQLHTHHAAQFG